MYIIYKSSTIIIVGIIVGDETNKLLSPIVTIIPALVILSSNLNLVQRSVNSYTLTKTFLIFTTP